MKNGPENRLPHQEDANEPKITRKIKAVNAENFYNDPYGEDTVGLEEQLEIYQERKPEEGPLLPYASFDPKTELENIRKLSPKEQAFSDKEKRRVRAERLVNFRENLIHQREGVAKVIRDLHSAVEFSPDATVETLLAEVQALAPEYKFTRNQIELFKHAIEDYREKHLAIEKYRAMYPNDGHLFEACFGKKPKGKIEIVKGPMTLFFRCFDRDDYAFVRNFYKHGGDETKFKPEDIARADDSAGVAISSVKIKELGGIVTAENIGNNHPRYELIEGAKKTEKIHGKEFELFIDSQKGDIDIEVNGVGVWKIKIVEHGEEGEPMRLQFINLDDVDTPPLFDVVRVESTEETRAHGNFIGHLRRVSDGHEQYNAIEYLKAKDQIRGYINLNRSFLKIVDDSPQGTIITYRENEFTLIPNEEMSERTRVHEDQHQFNKLFQPLETRGSMWDMMRRVVESATTPEEAIQKLIHNLVRSERKWIGFDSSARDEILAHYKDGQNTKAILHNLSKLKIYDYAEQYQGQIAKIPERVKKELAKEASEVFYQDVDGCPTAVDIRALKINEQEVLPHIESVFKIEYKNDLEKWLNSISVLEQKGYVINEIVALLYQEPVNYWSNLARRMKPKIKS